MKETTFCWMTVAWGLTGRYIALFPVALLLLLALVPGPTATPGLNLSAGTLAAYRLAAHPSPHPLPPDLASGDSADAQNVEFVGHVGGQSGAVTVQGSYAYLSAGPELAVIDISDPTNPQRVGYVMLSTYVEGIFVSGAYAYVADAGYGLRVIDVSDPANPSEIGFYDTPGSAYDVFVSGAYAYVAAGDSGLRVIDISDPANPSEIGFCYIPGTTYGVYITGSYAFLAAGRDGGLRIIDISNPAKPQEMGHCGTPGDAMKVTVAPAGDYAYVADGYTEGLQVIHISDPINPTVVASVEGLAYDVVVAGSYAYTAPGPYWYMRVIDISDPTNPIVVGSWYTFASSHIDIADSYAYITDSSRGLQVLDVSMPASPAKVGSYNTWGYIVDTAITDSYGYVAENGGYRWGTGSVHVVDISNPAGPREVGACETPDEATGFFVSSAYAYVADGGSGLRVIDLSDPTAPNEVAALDTPGYATAVYVSGPYAYVVGETLDYGGWLRVIDISDPTNPQRVGYVLLSTYVEGIFVSGAYAYVADAGYGLRVVDVSDPANPSEIGFYDTPGSAYDVFVSGAYAYVAAGDSGLRVIDISDPANPSEIGVCDTPGVAYDIFVSDSSAYLACGTGLQVVDVSDPANPTRIGYYDTQAGATGVYVSGPYVYLAAGAGGLYILRYTGGGPCFTITHIEVTQAIQDENDSVPLIAGKPTFVRVYVDSGEGCTSLRNVTGVLRGHGPSGELQDSPLSPVNHSITAHHDDWQSHRADLHKTLNFTLPPEWRAGTVTLCAEVAKATRSETVSFLPARSLTIAYLPVRYFDSTPDATDIATAHRFLLKTYPTATVDYFPLPTLNWYLPISVTQRLFALSLYTRFYMARIFHPELDHVFAWFPEGALPYGGASPGVPSRVAWGQQGEYAQRTIAHEIGHNRGLLHAPSNEGSIPGVPDGICLRTDRLDPYPDYSPYPLGSIGEYGFDTYTFLGIAYDPQTFYDMMTYCVPNAWISLYNYGRLARGERGVEGLVPGYGGSGQAVSLASTVLPEEVEYLITNGMIHVDDTVEFQPSWHITSTALLDTFAGTNYCLELQDASKTPLHSRCFDLDFVDDSGEPLEVAAFSIPMTYTASAARIVLKKGETELGVQSVSANAPVVTILSPNGGETWAATGTNTITWGASDADGDPLSYSVLYSPDGSSWIPVGTSITQTQLVVNAAELAGSENARIRVLASDGINTSSDESDGVFTVGWKPPLVYILSPTDNITISPGTVLWLQGYAYDLEEGLLEDSALQWSSSLAGSLGTGSQVLVTLSSGQHVITFTAQDSDGSLGQAQVGVYVGYRAFLPLVFKNR